MLTDKIDRPSQKLGLSSCDMWPMVSRYSKMVFPCCYMPHSPTLATKLSIGQADCPLRDQLQTPYRSGHLGDSYKETEGNAVWVAQPTDETIR